MELEEYRAPAKVKLAALWTATMFCYVYGDYFGLYAPGTLTDMARGVMGPLGPATTGVLVGVSLMMAVPSLMVALSLLLPARLCRWTCVGLGCAYTGIMALSLPGSALFYQVFGAIEMALTLTIAVIAFRWPRGTGLGAARHDEADALGGGSPDGAASLRTPPRRRASAGRDHADQCLPRS